jgi:hypothetical protein
VLHSALLVASVGLARATNITQDLPAEDYVQEELQKGEKREDNPVCQPLRFPKTILFS